MSRTNIPPDIEEFPRRIKIFFWVIILLFFFGTSAFMLISEESFKDALYRTAETLAFMFDDSSTTSERFLEIILALVGVFLIWWVLWGFADMIIEGRLVRYIKARFYSLKTKKMKEHIIIVGGGRVGEEISRLLYLRKKSFLIVELDSKVVHLLRKKKYHVIEGDALNEQVLKNASIEKASKIILTLPKTESNILLTLTAKEMNPGIEINSRCENASLTSKLKKAGAKIVIVPEVVAGDALADKLGI